MLNSEQTGQLGKMVRLLFVVACALVALQPIECVLSAGESSALAAVRQAKPKFIHRVVIHNGDLFAFTTNTRFVGEERKLAREAMAKYDGGRRFLVFKCKDKAEREITVSKAELHCRSTMCTIAENIITKSPSTSSTSSRSQRPSKASKPAKSSRESRSTRSSEPAASESRPKRSAKQSRSSSVSLESSRTQQSGSSGISGDFRVPKTGNFKSDLDELDALGL